MKLGNTNKTFVATNIKFMILKNNSQNLAQFDHVDHLDSPYMKKLVVLLSKNVQAKRNCPLKSFADPLLPKVF
jgi:hypothetical protein